MSSTVTLELELTAEQADWLYMACNNRHLELAELDAWGSDQGDWIRDLQNQLYQLKGSVSTASEGG